MKLTDEQIDALKWSDQIPLVRWTDGLWRGVGCKLGDDDFSSEDVRLLASCGLLELMPVGALITDQGREALASTAMTAQAGEQTQGSRDTALPSEE